jgi:putative FmdB family regulatory protein
MPIYEYLCQHCGKVSSFLILTRKEPFTPLCQKCGSQALTRLLSRVNVRLSEATRLERLADPASWAGLDEKDPRSMARMLKKMGEAMGEDYPGEVEQIVEEAMESEAQAGGEEAGEEPD